MLRVEDGAKPRLQVLEGGKETGKRPPEDEFTQRARLRRAREAGALYEAESAALLGSPKEGYLRLKGGLAADSYPEWAAIDGKARERHAATLSPEERVLYLALTEPQAERAARTASGWAARQGREAHTALLDAALKKLGEETFTLAPNLAGRAALLEAARPAAYRLAVEKAKVLGLPGEAVDDLFSEAMGKVAVAGFYLALSLDPVGASGFLEAAQEYLPPGFARAVKGELLAAVTRALALNLAEEALGKTNSREVAAHLVAEAAMPGGVEKLAGRFVAARLAAGELAERRREIAAERYARQKLFEAGGDVSRLDGDLWLDLSERSRADLASGRARVSDAREAGRLARLAVEKPDEFALADLTRSFYRLSPYDYALLEGHQEKLINDPAQQPPPRLEALAAKGEPLDTATVKPAADVLSALGRHIGRITGEAPDEECCAQVALAERIDRAGIFDDETRRGVLAEIMTLHHARRKR